LKLLPFVLKVYPSDANFVLIQTTDAKEIYHFLIAQKFIVRNRSSVSLCAGCLRITVGAPEENIGLIKALKKYQLL
jgi:histidinol-phosphate aminotransferase